ncbi:MAG TPA: IS481 family transposase [Nitrobacter sp.]|nr:IS481 family transposase [Nitrobacter sp.]
MPWREVSVMEQRREFVALAGQDGANRRELCRRFGISPQTGYKWLRRFAEGDAELADRSRRPHASPARSDAAIEDQVLAVRDGHPAWGARKIRHCLIRAGQEVPTASTVHTILVRHGRVTPPFGTPGQPYQRFEKTAPNLLWQMDFKGHVPVADGAMCHPLTIVDDHSRYAIGLQACGNEQSHTVQGRLEMIFRRYGLPEAFFVDNGSPWGDAGGERFTRLGVWLLKLGVAVIHSRPYHPQSRGKNERFHRTLKAEVFACRRFRNLAEVQRAFDLWRDIYNCDRPHEALGQQVPASRFQPSRRTMPDRLPRVEYDEHEIVRTVGTTKAYVSFKGRLWKVPQAFRGERVAIRPLNADGYYGIFFASHQIATIDLVNTKSVSYVSEQVSTMSPG